MSRSPVLVADAPTPVLVKQDRETPEINITGNHMLLALALAFCLAGPLAWAFVRYWLFAL